MIDSNYLQLPLAEEVKKDQLADRKAVLDKLENILNKNKIQYEISKDSRNKFLTGSPSIFGNNTFCISIDANEDEMKKICSLLNKQLAGLNAHVKRDNYNTIFLSMLGESTNLDLPNEATSKPDLSTILNNTDPKKIWFSSDWHIGQNHYKHEKNPINTQNIVTWCRQNLDDDDVFFYLGDICFRYANKKDQDNAANILNSIHAGTKVLILGNHDRMLGDEFYTRCGFDYVMEDFEWNNCVFTHRPINMDVYNDGFINIHGHIHNYRAYNTTDGKRNINVYPYYFDNKPVTFDYLIRHVEELTKENYWNANYGYGEQVYFSAPSNPSRIELLKLFNEASIKNYVVNNKPTVLFSGKIDSYTIALMVSAFKSKIKGRVAIKLHVGEEGNENYLKPTLLKDLVKHTHATLVDSNVAYQSKRSTTEGHKETAKLHGFSDIAYFDVLDADGDMVISVPHQNKIKKELEAAKNKTNYVPVISNGPHLTHINIGSHISAYDSMIVFTHFKGHPMAGYGGAVKNIGMGIPSGKEGKLQVHGSDFQSGPAFLERLVQSAAAIEDYFEGNIVYVNVLKNLSIDCDCEAHASQPKMKDIGVLVSDNLYAIEQASIDLIRNSPDNKDLMERIASKGGMHQIECMKFFGMAPAEGYVLKDLNGNRIRLEHAVVEESGKKNLNGFTIDDINKISNTLINGDEGYETKGINKNMKELIFRNILSTTKDGVKHSGWVEMYLSKDSTKDCHIASIAIEVDPDARGTGLSDELIKSAIASMKSLDVDRIEWYCKHSNTASYHLAKRCGFNEDRQFCNREWYTLYYGKSIVEETNRSNLPDSAFGIPEDRKYPLDTKQHVHSAIKLFGHAEESKKKDLAKRIRTAAKKYDISIPETTQVYRYLSEGGIDDTIPEDVNTIIFDIGGVLLGDNTHDIFMNGLAVSDHFAHVMTDFIWNVIFSKENMDKFERASIDEAKKKFLELAPDDIAPFTDKIFELIGKIVYKLPYVDELLSTLRAKGYRLYYLSNWTKFSYELQKEVFIPLLSKFDGGVFDFEYDVSKPDYDIYRILFDKYNLDPEKCFFFDDRAENVIAGEMLFMRGMVWNANETPRTLLNNNFEIPSSANNTIVINTGVALEAVDLSTIKWWFVSQIQTPSHPDEEGYWPTLEEAIHQLVSGFDATKVTYPMDLYVFTCNGANDLNVVLVGQIIVNGDETYEWAVQYPLNVIDGRLINPIKEWSMAACNPIQGINKPFILKVGNDSGSIINTKQYALSPDIIADKYLVVNENAQLEIVDSSYFDNCYIEAYEFVGDKTRLNKLNDFYRTGKIVDNTVFYTALTGKPMLCDDQIDFDSAFKKVDFDQIMQNAITEMATIRNGYFESIGIGAAGSIAVLESAYIDKVPFLARYNSNGDISVKEDFDGYYFYSKLTKKRSGSVASMSMLTESMLKSIL